LPKEEGEDGEDPVDLPRCHREQEPPQDACQSVNQRHESAQGNLEKILEGQAA
jgi:hypothetical protein